MKSSAVLLFLAGLFSGVCAQADRLSVREIGPLGVFAPRVNLSINELGTVISAESALERPIIWDALHGSVTTYAKFGVTFTPFSLADDNSMAGAVYDSHSGRCSFVIYHPDSGFSIFGDYGFACFAPSDGPILLAGVDRVIYSEDKYDLSTLTLYESGRKSSINFGTGRSLEGSLAVNSRGTVVGSVYDFAINNYRPFLLDRGNTLTYLDGEVPLREMRAIDITDFGVMILADRFKGLVFDPDTVGSSRFVSIELAGSSVRPAAISNSGRVVGTLVDQTTFQSRAFIWQSEKGLEVLSCFVPRKFDLDVLEADGINNHEAIAAVARSHSGAYSGVRGVYLFPDERGTSKLENLCTVTKVRSSLACGKKNSSKRCYHEVKVSSKDGKALAGVKVALLNSKSKKVLKTFTTNRTGSIRITPAGALKRRALSVIAPYKDDLYWESEAVLSGPRSMKQ